MYYPQLQPWQYSPYYMPHSMGHIGSNQSHLPPQDGKSHNYIPGSNTNININIPMYLPYPNSMYPLQSPRNYPMMPPPGSYMGYQYPPPYMPGQPMLPKKDFHK